MCARGTCERVGIGGTVAGEDVGDPETSEQGHHVREAMSSNEGEQLCLWRLVMHHDSVWPARGAVLDASIDPCLDSRPTSRIQGYERDEYASNVGRETRRLVEAGTAAARNGPGSLRTERTTRRRGIPVGSGAERQR